MGFSAENLDNITLIANLIADLIVQILVTLITTLIATSIHHIVDDLYNM